MESTNQNKLNSGQSEDATVNELTEIITICLGKTLPFIETAEKCFDAEHHEIDWAQIRSLADGLVSCAARMLSLGTCNFIVPKIMDYGRSQATANIRITVKQRIESMELNELKLGLHQFLAGITEKRPPGMDSDLFQDNVLEGNTNVVINL